LDHLHDVGEFVREILGGGFLCFAGLLGELGQQCFLVARIVQDPCDRVLALCLDDFGDPVTDQLVVADCGMPGT
jgi:hypothetical protein